MMSRNSSTVFSRPWALTLSCNGTSTGMGAAPMMPAATWTFCSRIAATTSAAVMLCRATFCGSSQTRME
ncbi:hypothetical protein D3C85_1474220 [compost metagenome]